MVVQRGEQMTSYGPGPAFLKVFVANGQLPLRILHNCSWTLSFLFSETWGYLRVQQMAVVFWCFSHETRGQNVILHPSIHPSRHFCVLFLLFPFFDALTCASAFYTATSMMWSDAVNNYKQAVNWTLLCRKPASPLHAVKSSLSLNRF